MGADILARVAAKLTLRPLAILLSVNVTLGIKDYCLFF